MLFFSPVASWKLVPKKYLEHPSKCLCLDSENQLRQKKNKLICQLVRMCAWLDLHVSINPHVFSNVGVYLSVKVRVCLLLNSSTEVYINKNLHCGRVCTVSSVENKTTHLIVLNACCQSSYTITYIMITSNGKTKQGFFFYEVSHMLRIPVFLSGCGMR